MQVSMLDTDFGFNFTNETNNQNGWINLEAGTVNPPDGNVVLGSFRIDGTALGLDALMIAQLSENTNLLADGTNFSNLYPDDVLATINQVPIPGAVWLLGGGLMGLLGLRRKFKN